MIIRGGQDVFVKATCTELVMKHGYNTFSENNSVWWMFSILHRLNVTDRRLR